MSEFDPFADVGSGPVKAGSLRIRRRSDDIPKAIDLGRRFATLRADAGLSLENVACISGHEQSAIKRFERHGDASADLLLSLVQHFSSSSRLEEAFKTPKFRSVDDVVRVRVRRRLA